MYYSWLFSDGLLVDLYVAERTTRVQQSSVLLVHLTFVSVTSRRAHFKPELAVIGDGDNRSNLTFTKTNNLILHDLFIGKGFHKVDNKEKINGHYLNSERFTGSSSPVHRLQTNDTTGVEASQRAGDDTERQPNYGCL